MLNKLLKYEFKATSKLLPVGYLFIVIVFLLGLFAKNVFHAAVAYTLPAILLLLGSIFVLIFTYVVTITRFYKSLFGSEGYLTQTLPVSKAQLLGSRIIVFVVWFIAGTIAFIAGLFGFLYLLTSDVANVWETIRNVFLSSPWYFGYLLASTIIGAFLFAFEIFFCICLANTSKFLRNNIAFSFVFYIIIMAIVGVVDVLTMMFIPLSIKTDVFTGQTSLMFKTMFSGMAELGPSSATSAVTYIGVGSVIFDVILIGVLWALSNHLLKNKVNVK